MDAACGKGPPQLLSLLLDMSQAPHQHHAWPSEGQGLFRCCSTPSASLCCLIFPALQGRRHGNAWKIHRTIQLISSQIMTRENTRSSGTGGRQMPETCFLGPGRDLPQPQLSVCGRECLSTGWRQCVESLRRVMAQERMSPLISNVTFVGHL